MLLIIDKSSECARTIASIFHYMGILASASTSADAILSMSNRYKAIIVVDPEETCADSEFITALKTYSLAIPAFALCEDPSCFKENFPDKYRIFNGVFSADSYSSDILTSINEFLSTRGVTPIGTYKLAGIDASAFIRGVHFFDKCVPLTKTEQMILRYLISMYPMRVNAKMILENGFRYGKQPELASVRTHISSINKKFYYLTGRYWISSESGLGYRILTPELLRKSPELAIK